MSAPETEAGRALLDHMGWHGRTSDLAYLIDRTEAEARQSALAEAIRRVEEAWTTHGAISQAVVIRILRDLASRDTGATTGGPTFVQDGDRWRVVNGGSEFDGRTFATKERAIDAVEKW